MGTRRSCLAVRGEFLCVLLSSVLVTVVTFKLQSKPLITYIYVTSLLLITYIDVDAAATVK
jgi:hypothetical protein